MMNGARWAGGSRGERIASPPRCPILARTFGVGLRPLGARGTYAECSRISDEAGNGPSMALAAATRVSGRLRGCLLLALCLVAAPPATAPARAEANECHYDAPTSVAQVSGHAWTGELHSVRKMPNPDDHTRVLTFRVTSARKGVDVEVGRFLRLFNGPCHGQPLDMGLRVGHDYLISSSDAPSQGRLTTQYIVVWEIHGEDVVWKSRFYNERSPIARVFRDVDSFDEALALVTAPSPDQIVRAFVDMVVRFVNLIARYFSEARGVAS